MRSGKEKKRRGGMKIVSAIKAGNNEVRKAAASSEEGKSKHIGRRNR